MAILTVFVIISFFVFLAFCCCCDRAGSDSTTCSKICTIVAVIFLVTFIALFITMIVYIGMMSARLNNSACAVGRVPYDLLRGGEAPGIRFVGLYNVTYMIGNFSQQIPNTPQATPQFISIFGRNLAAQTAITLQSAESFFNKYRNSTTSDGAGALSRPWTVQSLTPGVNSLIGAEFTTYNYAATQLQYAAAIGIGITLTTANVQLYQNAMNEAVTTLRTTIRDVEGTPADVTSGIAAAIIYSPIGYWITFGFGLFIIAMMIIMVIFVSLMYSRPTDNCRCCAKTFLVITTLLIVILGLLCIALLIASAAITSVCKAIPSVLNANSSQLPGVLRGWGVNLSASMQNVLNNCVASDATGNVTLVINSTNPAVPAGLNFLDGILAFRNLQANLTREQTVSPAINTTLSNWTNIQVSIIADQANALTSLNTLNDQTSCGGQTYRLNSFNCSGASNCIGIYNTATTTLPSCAPSSAQTVFTNLKAYTTSEATLLTNMIADLNSTTGNPNSLQAAYRASMISAFPEFNQVLAVVGAFTNSVSSQIGGFYYNTNCTIMRQEVLNLEATICFAFANPLYYFTALLCFLVLFFFFFAWLLCCALRCLPMADSPHQTGGLRNAEMVPVMEDRHDMMYMKADPDNVRRAQL
jgi:hypothetical protein